MRRAIVMRAYSRAAVAVLLCTVGGALAAPSARGDGDRFYNVVAGGQGENVDTLEGSSYLATGDPPVTFVNQNPLYEGLYYAMPTIAQSEVEQFFKPAGFGVPHDEVASRKTFADRPGVTILRDAYSVPRIYGDTRRDAMFGAGYAAAEDRLFFMDVFRHLGRGRLSELAGRAAGLELDRAQFRVADYSEDELGAMVDALSRRYGAEGERAREDIAQYVAGINAYIAETQSDSTKLPVEYPALQRTPRDWTPQDVAAAAAVFGAGELPLARESTLAEVLLEARRRFGRRSGYRVYRDFRGRDDPEAAVTLPERFEFASTGRPRPRAFALPDLGSLARRDPVVGADEGAGTASGWLDRLRQGLERGIRLGSNALFVGGRRSRSGHPLSVAGPQTGYFSPQIHWEFEIHAPGIDMRGITLPGLGPYPVVGHGRDFALGVTSSYTDNVDEFAERLCEPDGDQPTLESDHYVYNGQCIPFEVREESRTTTPNPIDSSPPATYRMRSERSVHGPIQARATVGGAPVALALSRPSYFRELDTFAIVGPRLASAVRSARSLRRAVRPTYNLLNWFYADDRDIAYVNADKVPLRARGTHPDLPTWGTGRFDWRGFQSGSFSFQPLAPNRLPRVENPPQGYLVNWNNKPAPGWRGGFALEWSSQQRVVLLMRRLRAALRRGKIDLAKTVEVMEGAATADLVGPTYRWLRRVVGRPRSDAAVSWVRALDDWWRSGAHRRDLDRDNVYEHSAAIALMDAWWPRLVEEIYRPILGSDLYDRLKALMPIRLLPGIGWYTYVEKDLRALLGRRVRGPLSRGYCGRDSLRRCRATLRATLRAAAAAVSERYGENMADWKVPATCPIARPPACDQIEFAGAGLVAQPPIPWQNRGTSQHVAEVRGNVGSEE